jgi:D-ribose pyranose/furanose isomerase RbsD
MIDEAKLAALKTQQSRTHVRGQVLAPAHLPVPTLREQLQSMSEKDLRTLQDLLNELLPEQSVKELNLEDELLQQYTKTKRLMDDVMDDIDVAPNQKAQVANSVVGTLGQLVKLQEDLKLQEAMKLMEATLIDVIKTLPQDVKDEFFSVYEAQAKKAGLA